MNLTKENSVELVEAISCDDALNKKSRAPEGIRMLSPEQRQKAEKALVRKIDFRLLPMIVLMYILNYLDRNNIAAARLAGLESDLNLHGDQFQVDDSPNWTRRWICSAKSDLILSRLLLVSCLWGIS